MEIPIRTRSPKKIVISDAFYNPVQRFEIVFLRFVNIRKSEGYIWIAEDSIKHRDPLLRVKAL